MRRVFDFFTEYDIIRLEGKYIEKFFNIVARKKIQLWNVRYIDKTAAVFSCYKKDYGEILKISDKISVKLYIMDSKGAMHEIRKYKNRVSLYLGAILMTVVIILLSNTVCVISVTGTKRIPKETIYEQLEDCGLYKGRAKTRLDIKDVRKKILALNNDIAWIGIDVKGAKVTVEVVEKVPKPEIVDKNIPVNIVASKEGIIESITVKDGFVIAKKGDTVTKGQLLVSGLNESKQGDVMIAHADADIKLKTWNYVEESYHVNVKERVSTGELKRKYKLNFFGIQINLFFDNISDDNYNIKIQKQNLAGDWISIERIDCERINTIEKKYSPKKVFEMNKEKVYNKAMNLLAENSMVLETEYDYDVIGDKVNIKLCVVAIEDGGTPKEAQF